MLTKTFLKQTLIYDIENAILSANKLLLKVKETLRCS